MPNHEHNPQPGSIVDASNHFVREAELADPAMFRLVFPFYAACRGCHQTIVLLAQHSTWGVGTRE